MPVAHWIPAVPVAAVCPEEQVILPAAPVVGAAAIRAEAVAKRLPGPAVEVE